MKTTTLARLSVLPVALAFTLNAQATVLLSDSFDATGIGGDTANINFNLAGRQAGSLATQGWNGFGTNTQVGNSTNVGQPPATVGNYLLMAFSAKAALTGLVLNSTTVPAPLLISFDMFQGATGPTDWTSFTLTSSVPVAGWDYAGSSGGHYVVGGTTEFGFARFGDGTSADAHLPGVVNFWDINYTTSGDSFSFLLSDTAGTGSAWGSGGSKITVMNGATTLATYTFTNQLTSSYITFGANGGIGGIDNLVVQTIPEPTSLGLLAIGITGVMLRRRRLE